MQRRSYLIFPYQKERKVEKRKETKYSESRGSRLRGVCISGALLNSSPLLLSPPTQDCSSVDARSMLGLIVLLHCAMAFLVKYRSYSTLHSFAIFQLFFFGPVLLCGAMRFCYSRLVLKMRVRWDASSSSSSSSSSCRWRDENKLNGRTDFFDKALLVTTALLDSSLDCAYNVERGRRNTGPSGSYH